MDNVVEPGLSRNIWVKVGVNGSLSLNKWWLVVDGFFFIPTNQQFMAVFKHQQMIWINKNVLNATSPQMMVSSDNFPIWPNFQVSEI